MFHVVSSGENLTIIAKKHNCTVEQIVAWNNLKNPNLIWAGQRLLVQDLQIVLPPSVGNAGIYQVRVGDTLTSIATKHKCTVDQLLRLNQIKNPNLISIGQILNIPNREIGAIVANSASSNLLEYPIPLPYRLTQGFGARVGGALTDSAGRVVVNYGAAGHTGVDFAVGLGTPVRASAAGIVGIARVQGIGYGIFVLVNHNDGILSSLYAHLSRFVVSLGERVTAGQILGYSGTTGASTGPHLHFEVRKYGIAVNPFDFLRGVDF